ncbi:preprotein translocase subunit SecF [Isoalcanivorax pacificus W11-5]|uniref:Protein-export membrane protein SecF n=1 Tax=Isoalcanivorax pacificus W11-5 TaxID=391936 RepID=A0A0B4XKB0_9GAMM|nr:protein translocase subunit SecF [Isoalcanivorax pacificus]AJD47140.1 preprotein translocase subunit SecF [Isoalcanivorax pacificus W11-5]
MTTTPEKNVNFMKLALPMGILSIVLVLASVVLLATRGLNLGLDFTGGTVVEVAAPQDIALNDLRDALAEGGYADAIVQHFGSSRDVVVRVPPHETDNGDEVGLAVFEMVSSAVPSLELRRVEFVGPQVGDELRDQSGLAVLFAMGAMLAYIWFRFTNKFGVAALLALVHDVIVVLGAFALFRWQFDLTVLAAVLAVVGYSINDTIVIADHIREDFRSSRQSDTRTIINHSITRTLSRTMITSATTLLVLIALYVFGGEMISGFAITLIIGVLVGTYSSVYVANGLLLLMKVDKEDFVVPERTEVDEMP